MGQKAVLFYSSFVSESDSFPPDERAGEGDEGRWMWSLVIHPFPNSNHTLKFGWRGIRHRHRSSSLWNYDLIDGVLRFIRIASNLLQIILIQLSLLRFR